MLTKEEIKLKVSYIKGFIDGMDEGWSADKLTALNGELKALKEVLNESEQNQ